MLTKNDLQQIRRAVQEEVHIETQPIKQKLNKVAKDLDTVIDHFDKRITKVEKDVKVLQQSV